MKIELFDLTQVNKYAEAIKEIYSLLPVLDSNPEDVSLLNHLAYLYFLAGKNDLSNNLISLAIALKPDDFILQENKKIIQENKFVLINPKKENLTFRRHYEMTKLSRGRVLCGGNTASFTALIPFFEKIVFIDDNFQRLQENHSRIREWFDQKICVFGQFPVFPFPGESFDTIIILAETPLLFLEESIIELSRVCSPEGQIFLEIDQLNSIPNQFVNKARVENLVKKHFPLTDCRFIEMIEENVLGDFHILIWIENKKTKIQPSKPIKYSPRVYKTEKKVSIIIPTYNRADSLLPRAINSVLSQNYSPLEVVVVDDGSTDHTEKVIQGYGDQIKYIKLPHTGITPTKIGGTVSLNEGIKQSSGDYISLLCDDDILLPRSIETRVRYLESHPNDDLVCSNTLMLDAKHRQFLNLDVMPLSFESSAFKLMLIDVGNFFFLSAQLYRKEIFQKIGLLNEASPLADGELNFKVARYFKIGLMPVFSVIMFPSGGVGLSSTEQLVNAHKSLLRNLYYEIPLEDIFPKIKGFPRTSKEYLNALLIRANRMTAGGVFPEALQDFTEAVEIFKYHAPERESMVMEVIKITVKSLDTSLEFAAHEYFQFFNGLKKILAKDK